jgi:fluoride exporter
MSPYFLVMAGGALGAVMRYQFSRWLPVGTGWPWATFAVNVVGGLAMGLLAAWAYRTGHATEGMRLLLGAGVLGGFTTFSAFSLEMAMMIERGQLGMATGYALASVLLAVLAVFAGLALGRGVWA